MDASQWIRVVFALGVGVLCVQADHYYQQYQLYRPKGHYMRMSAPTKVVHIHHVHSGSNHGSSGYGYGHGPSYSTHDGHYYHHGESHGHGTYGSGGKSDGPFMKLLLLSSLLSNSGSTGLLGSGANTNTNVLPAVIAGGLG